MQQNSNQHHNQDYHHNQDSQQKEEEKEEKLVSFNVDLKKNFLNFRRQKQEHYKHQKYLKEKCKKERYSKEFKENLRKKFIETAKKYFGVPYGKKYHKEGSKHYNSPLFLDCCALIRQVIFDLKEDFGFVLERWNQAYQVDTLPIDLEFEQLQPGDLVFYSADYYNTKLKDFPHKMVHVEIYIGPEEQTIGARWNNGVVQIFESYKFVSKSYHNIKFHFKSIDTWLEGVCKSWCSEHKWLRNESWEATRNSVFGADMQQQIEDNEIQRVGYIGPGNNRNIVKTILLKFNIDNTDKEYSNNYLIKWVQLVSDIDYLSFKENKQIANHISNIMQIYANKKYLVQILEDYVKKVGVGLDKVVPKTYRLDSMADQIRFINDTEEGVWILKPYNMNMGRGIQIIDDIVLFRQLFVKTKVFQLGLFSASYLFKNNTKLENEIKNQLSYLNKDTSQHQQSNQQTNQQDHDQQHQNNQPNQDGGKQTKQDDDEQTKQDDDEQTKQDDDEQTKQNDDEQTKQNDDEQTKQDDDEQQIQEKKKEQYQKIKQDCIVQKYINNPLLINGRKFDLRMYCIIVNCKPLLILYKNGYLRLSPVEYNYSDFSNKYMHFTNQTVQMKNKNYKSYKDDLNISIDEFKKHLEKEYSETEINKLFKRMKGIISLTMMAGKDQLDLKQGLFEILGCDIMIDQELNPYLLEINTNPAYFTKTALQKQVIPTLIQDVIEMVLDFNNSDPKTTIEQIGEQYKGFEVIYNEMTNYQSPFEINK